MGNNYVSMTHVLIFGFDEQFAKWTCDRIPWMSYHPGMRAVGVADGDTADAKVLAAIVYHNHIPGRTIGGQEWYNTIEVSFAASSPRFATRQTITNLLKIPFDQYKVTQVLLSVPSINERALRFVKGIGFTSRGTVAHYFAKGVHAHVLGLHRNTFKSHFLKKEKRPMKRAALGQEHPVAAAAASA